MLEHKHRCRKAESGLVKINSCKRTWENIIVADDVVMPLLVNAFAISAHVNIDPVDERIVILEYWTWFMM